MIHFTSDEHYGHDNVIKFCHRPFANVDEMREGLIARHNAVVRPGDLVYHLGDMFWRTCSESEALEIVDRLNGDQYYINGNHEELMRKSPKLRSRFVYVKDLAKINTASGPSQIHPRIVLFHYAMLVWEGSHRGDWQLYGHSHGELSSAIPDKESADRLMSFDVGVDCWDYTPVSMDKVIAVMNAKAKDQSPSTKPHEIVCTMCDHNFNSYSRTRAICSRCDSLMTVASPVPTEVNAHSSTV